MKKGLGFIVLLLVVVTLAYGQNQKATNRGAPGQVPLGGMIAVMPTMHANAWQPPATGAIKDGFMRADGATISAQNVTDGSQLPAGTVLPNMVSAFPRGATTSAVAATGSDTRDISHTHTMAHTHDTSVAHTHGYGFSHTHGTDTQLGTLSLAHNHNYSHVHQTMYTSPYGTSSPHYTYYMPSVGDRSSTSFTGGEWWVSYPYYFFGSAISGAAGGTFLMVPSVGSGSRPYYTTGVSSGVNGTGSDAQTDSQLGNNNLSHSHSTNSQTGTTGTTTSQSAATFTSGAASTATTTSGGSASLDIKPAYLNTVWVIRVK